MLIDINYGLLEHNQCPQCMAAFIKHGTGYDRGIHCGACGFETPMEKYRSVMAAVVARKLAEKDED